MEIAVASRENHAGFGVMCDVSSVAHDQILSITQEKM
jgi:hypothetical protein